ncbi:hypothetical protein L8R80_20685 [Vibrio splendidus]|uniref:hypothetical protein n=1 Tax=Vibrio splendidus TaxID=29497 RepID=UPI000D3722B8|nr:hypothetical protein [Vibrio splendidus]MDH5901823.1 hypothetical protein [Vibrio splendidus]MDH5912185.1 hypothetical protein [Vibrio splendidus]MDH5940807.1 hypothetical protein [Vibrio splendidus]MDH5985021.1 hypothetical protein [Vibrio splendidus]MDH5995646.1 hypothetical protein [Vibrio splendidus]
MQLSLTFSSNIWRILAIALVLDLLTANANASNDMQCIDRERADLSSKKKIKIEVCYAPLGVLEQSRSWLRPSRDGFSTGVPIKVTNLSNNKAELELKLLSIWSHAVAYQVSPNGQAINGGEKFRSNTPYRVRFGLESKESKIFVVRLFQSNPNVHTSSLNIFVNNTSLAQSVFRASSRKGYCSLVVYDDRGEISFDGLSRNDPTKFTVSSFGRGYFISLGVDSLTVNNRKVSVDTWSQVLDSQSLFVLKTGGGGYPDRQLAHNELYPLRKRRRLDAEVYANFSNIPKSRFRGGKLEMGVTITCQK